MSRNSSEIPEIRMVSPKFRAVAAPQSVVREHVSIYLPLTYWAERKIGIQRLPHLRILAPLMREETPKDLEELSAL